MHALFHIRTVIIPRNRYRPEGFSPRVHIGRGMLTVLIWKMAYINLFITYFNILKYIQCKLFDVIQFDNCKSVYSVACRLFDVSKGTEKYVVLYLYFYDALMKAMNNIRNSFKIVEY